MPLSEDQRAVGGGVVCLTLCGWLFGIVTVQSYLYYSRFWCRDRWWNKSVVAFLWTIQLFILLTYSTTVRDYVVLSFSKKLIFNSYSWQLSTAPAATVTSALLVYLSFTRMLGSLYPSALVTGALLILILVDAAFGYYYVWLIYCQLHDRPSIYVLGWPTIVWTILNVVTSLLLTVGMSYLLLRNRTGHVAGDALISNMVRHLAQTGFFFVTLMVLNAASILHHAPMMVIISGVPVSGVVSAGFIANLLSRSPQKGFQGRSAHDEDDDDAFGVPTMLVSVCRVRQQVENADGPLEMASRTRLESRFPEEIESESYLWETVPASEGHMKNATSFSVVGGKSQRDH